ncbi:MAG TPA: riboflavin biosynthesis protein RibF [Opitutaceae bacterium]|nr:riboflavin biosynthesis protein RibF [Opitutaceae bacterium]HND62893.1 riboflavin biosynthesis protein RibF [Opitutaceae bacterium]
MNPIQQFAGLEQAVLPPGPLHLAIGMFDGVHLGHRAVIEAAVQSARRSGGTAAVLTFHPHPSVLFRPAQPTRMIMDLANKARVLHRLGVEVMITQPFTPEFARVAALDFLPWLRQRAPRLAAVYVGENFRFGQGRVGDISLLVAEGRKQGLTIFSAPRVNFDGEPISSTRIRALLEAGEVAAANALLGYSYFAEGPVVAGKRMGRTIGFPTLNVAWAPDLRPRFGVYVVRVAGAKAVTPLPGVANYGLRPTLEQAVQPLLEAHLLGECPFETGDAVTVKWLRFLRPERKFGGVDELRAQIARDRAEAAADFSLR